MRADMLDNADNNTVPLNHAVWDAWLAKNRSKERRFNARLGKIVLIIAAAGLLLSFGWLAMSR